MDIRSHFKKVAIFKDLKSQSLNADLIIGYDDEHLNALKDQNIFQSARKFCQLETV